MELTILGTGNALVTECYNTCFAIKDGDQTFLVDGGGGNGIMHQLKEAGIDWRSVKDIFVTHKHIDHVSGIIWLIRLIGTDMAKGIYDGEVNIYAHAELIDIIRTLAELLLQKKQTVAIGKTIHLIPVEDGETREILGCPVTFFDIHSTKAKQYGFTMMLPDGEKLTCCGDEPCSEFEEEYVRDADWLMHEAFCLYSEADIFNPYSMHHSTVREACETAQRLGAKNLILYHTEQTHLPERKALYSAEGRNYFSGNLFVPDDLDVFEIGSRKDD